MTMMAGMVCGARARRSSSERQAGANRMILEMISGCSSLRAWIAVALAFSIVAGLVAMGSAAAESQPGGRVIYERVTKTARWLEARDLFGGSRIALTRRPDPGEIRRDCCATWSPDGTKVAFLRRTPKQFGLFVVD